jgi:hypothetical protein
VKFRPGAFTPSSGPSGLTKPPNDFLKELKNMTATKVETGIKVPDFTLSDKES